MGIISKLFRKKPKGLNRKLPNVVKTETNDKAFDGEFKSLDRDPNAPTSNKYNKISKKGVEEDNKK